MTTKMHSLPYDGSSITTNKATIHRLKPAIAPIRRDFDNNGRIVRKSSKCDIFLPPIHKPLMPTPLANLETAKNWSNTTKELISQEWDKLQRIKQRGTLAPKYSVLPPINNKSKNSNTGDTLGFTADGLSSKGETITAKSLRQMLQATENGGEESSTNSDKEIKHRRSSKRNKRRSKDIDANNGESSTDTVQLPKINEQSKANMTIIETEEDEQRTVKAKEEAKKKDVVLPKIPSPSLSKSKNALKIEERYSTDMIEWARFKGRRHAICYEMDPLFRELTSIIKYNLLVQHLEDIWMC
eukprot:TCONS_00067177-protein